MAIRTGQITPIRLPDFGDRRARQGAAAGSALTAGHNTVARERQAELGRQSSERMQQREIASRERIARMNKKAQARRGGGGGGAQSAASGGGDRWDNQMRIVEQQTLQGRQGQMSPGAIAESEGMAPEAVSSTVAPPPTASEMFGGPETVSSDINRDIEMAEAQQAEMVQARQAEGYEFSPQDQSAVDRLDQQIGAVKEQMRKGLNRATGLRAIRELMGGKQQYIPNQRVVTPGERLAKDGEMHDQLGYVYQMPDGEWKQLLPPKGDMEMERTKQEQQHQMNAVKAFNDMVKAQVDPQQAAQMIQNAMGIPLTAAAGTVSPQDAPQPSPMQRAVSAAQTFRGSGAQPNTNPVGPGTPDYYNRSPFPEQGYTPYHEETFSSKSEAQKAAARMKAEGWKTDIIEGPTSTTSERGPGGSRTTQSQEFTLSASKPREMSHNEQIEAATQSLADFVDDPDRREAATQRLRQDRIEQLTQQVANDPNDQDARDRLEDLEFGEDTEQFSEGQIVQQLQKDYTEYTDARDKMLQKPNFKPADFEQAVNDLNRQMSPSREQFYHANWRQAEQNLLAQSDGRYPTSETVRDYLESQWQNRTQTADDLRRMEYIYSPTMRKNVPPGQNATQFLEQAYDTANPRGVDPVQQAVQDPARRRDMMQRLANETGEYPNNQQITQAIRQEMGIRQDMPQVNVTGEELLRTPPGVASQQPRPQATQPRPQAPMVADDMAMQKVEEMMGDRKLVDATIADLMQSTGRYPTEDEVQGAMMQQVMRQRQQAIGAPVPPVSLNEPLPREMKDRLQMIPGGEQLIEMRARYNSNATPDQIVRTAVDIVAKAVLTGDTSDPDLADAERVLMDAGFQGPGGGSAKGKEK